MSAGNAKMLAPIVVLMMFAARPGTPIARTNCASALRGGSQDMAEHRYACRGAKQVFRGASEMFDFARNDLV